MEIFSKFLDLRYNMGLIGCHPHASNPKISHLVFADDIMVFFYGKKTSLQSIVSLLYYLSQISGLSMNKSKSSLFLAGVSDVEKEAIK